MQDDAGPANGRALLLVTTARETGMKRHILAAVLFGIPAGTAMAQDFPADRIIAAATGDWNKDGAPDLALLVAPGDDSDMISIDIFLQSDDHKLLKPVAQARDKIFGNYSHDGLYGNDPDIKALGNGSIAVTSQQNAIGRNRWEQTLTIAYRNGDFVVAGYTYNYYDTLDPDAAGKCDYNVLTGKAMVNDKPAKVAPRTIKIQDWDQEKDRGPCPTG